MADRPIQFEAIDELHARFVRRLTGAQRLAMAWDMWDWARQLVGAGLKAAHPDWSEGQLEHQIARRMVDASG